MKVKIGDYNLLESITIIQMHNSPIYCELEDKIEGDVHLEIDFKEDRNESRPYTNIKAQDNYKLLITIYNQKDNGGNLELIKIGTYMRKYELYINIRIVDIHDDTHTIILNLYTKEMEG